MTGPIAPVFRSHPDTEGMAHVLAAEIAGRLTAAVERDDSAGLIVSGGHTPRLLYRCLSRQKAPWSEVTVGLADERWVDPASPDSNERLVRETLLANEAAPARFIGLKTRHSTPQAGAPACNRAAAAFKRPFAVVLLGMGEDGHTASLFPGARELDSALDPDNPYTYMALHPVNGQGAAALPRMTMTLAGMLGSRSIVLMIAGAVKRAVYETALADDDAAAMPVRAVLHQARAPVEVHWAP